MTRRPTDHIIRSLLFLLPFFLALPLQAQVRPNNTATKWMDIYDPSDDATLQELQQNFNTYWRGREIGKGKGYKPFKRWEAHIAPRIYPSQDLSAANSTFLNYTEWARKQKSSDDEKSFAGNWTPLGPFTKATGEDTGVGRLNMVRFDPINKQIMYVGAADGGLWKSTNGGMSWTTNTDFLGVIGVADLAIDPSNTAIMYLATGDVESDRRSIGVLKSLDGGATWPASGLSWTAVDNYSIRKMLMHPSNSQILLVATNKGVFRTTDGGATWSTPATIENFKDMEFKPGDPNTVYATSTEVWKSTNNGVSWAKITAGVPTTDVSRMALAVTADQPNTVYLMAGKESNGGLLGVYRSTNSGTSFTTRFEPNYSGTLGTPTNPNILGNEPDGSDADGQSFYTLAIDASPTDGDFLLTGGVSQWASYDGGATWFISSHWAPDPDYQFVHADTHEVLFSEDGTKAFSSHDGGLAMYTDATGDWTDLSNNLNISQQNIIGMSATSPNKIAAGLQDIGTILNTAPSTWKVIGGGDGEYCFIDYTDDDVIVETGTNGSHAISLDGGDTFFDIVDGLPTDASTGEVEFQSPIHQDPLLPNRYYAGGRKELYRSDNQGSDWTMLGLVFPDDDSNITEFKIAPNDNQVIYATNMANIAKSTDGGLTWDYLPEPTLEASFTQIAISNVDADKVWVTCSGYSGNDKVFRSVDGGDTWTNLSAGLPNLPFNTVVYQNGSEDQVYIGGDIGVYYRDNNSTGWTPFFDALPRTSVRDLKIFYPTMQLRAATYGRGTWQTDLAVALPVTLLSFTGTTDGKVNRLAWVTTQESNLDRYQIERSRDGVNFQNIGQRSPLPWEASGEKTYAFEDAGATTGLNYYRLKISDLDGTFQYSRTISIFVADSSSDIVLFPNPVNNRLRIAGLKGEVVAVSVLDHLGRTVIEQTVSIADGLNVSRLPNGAYFIQLAVPEQPAVYMRFVKE